MLTTPARRGGLGHFGGVVLVGGQRLFAQHMLARGQQRHGGGMVHRVGGDVRGGIEIAPGQRIGNDWAKPCGMPCLA